MNEMRESTGRERKGGEIGERMKERATEKKAEPECE